MKQNASGESWRKVTLEMGVEFDPRAGDQVRRAGATVKKAQADTAAAAKAAEEKQEADTARYWMARMTREKQYAAEIRKNSAEKERLDKKALANQEEYYRKLGSWHMASMRRQQQADREQMRQGAAMAREYDQQISARAQAQRRAARREAAQDREDRSGFRQAGMGAMSLGRGVLEFAAARQFGGTGRANAEGSAQLLQNLVNIQALSHSVGGVADIAGGLGRTRLGGRAARAGRRMASRFLLGGEALASGLGLSGVGASGGSSLAAAGMLGGAATAAVAGTAAGTYAAFDFRKQVSKHGFMGGADPNSYTGRMGSLQASAMQSMASVMPDSINNLAPKWTSYAAAADAAKQEQRATRMQRNLDRNVAARQDMEQRDEEQFRDRAPFDAIRQSRRMEADARNTFNSSRSFLTNDAQMGLRASAMANANEIGRLTSANKDPGIGPAERKANEQQVLALMMKQEEVLKQQGELERQTSKVRMDSLKAQMGSIASQSVASREGLKSKQTSLGAMGAKDFAEAGALLSRFRSTGSIEGMTPEQIASIRGFGDRKINTDLDKQEQERGKARQKELGIFTSEEAEQDTNRGRMRSKSKEIVSKSDLFSAPQAGFSLSGRQSEVTSTIAVSLNLDASAGQSSERLLAALGPLIEQHLKRIQETAGDDAARAREATKQAQNQN